MKQPHLWDVKVPMRDGVHLAANVLFPEGDGPFPVLLNRTPYIKDTAMRLQRAKAYLEAGYAVVHQDVRGRGNSEGVFDPYFQEIQDGHDTIEWCGTQAWSDGNVGTYGGSYEGWTQIYPTRLQSAHHKAAFLMCAPSMHPFHEGPYWSGVPMPIMALWTVMVSGKTMKEQVTELDWESVVKVRPLRNLLSQLGLAVSYNDERLKHDTLDEFWQGLWFEGLTDLTLVPCYHVTGWFDDDQKGTLDHFPALATDHPDPVVRGNQKLLIGPWPHRLSTDSSKLGDFDYGAHSMVPLHKEAIRWFDHFLRGRDNGVTDEPRCRLFVMGANRWIDAGEFPIADAEERSFLLGADGPANSLQGRGTLDLQAHGTRESSSFTYDPERPAPNPFWKENFQNGTNEDLRPIQRRDDVLVFTSAPLEEPLTTVGLLRAELWVSTTVKDTDIVARLSDVHPDGYAKRLNSGILRLRYREGYEQVVLVEPGEVMRVEVDMWATGHQFAACHRVRLEVTSSGFPTWAPNYNTGGDVWDEEEAVIADTTVHHSAEHPSRLVLQVLPEPRFVDSWAESRWS